jgi:hypothetical protein
MNIPDVLAFERRSLSWAIKHLQLLKIHGTHCQSYSTFVWTQCTFFSKGCMVFFSNAARDQIPSLLSYWLKEWEKKKSFPKTLQANEEHTFTVLGKCTFEPFWGKNIKCTRIRILRTEGWIVLLHHWEYWKQAKLKDLLNCQTAVETKNCFVYFRFCCCLKGLVHEMDLS